MVCVARFPLRSDRKIISEWNSKVNKTLGTLTGSPNDSVILGLHSRGITIGWDQIFYDRMQNGMLLIDLITSWFIINMGNCTF